MDGEKMLTVKEVSVAYRMHPVTVRVALTDGALHGRQRVPAGRWLIQASCADAWSRGDKCEHMLAEPIKFGRKRA